MLFGSLCACVVLVIRIIEELWQERERGPHPAPSPNPDPSSRPNERWQERESVFKSDEVLDQLVLGLAEEPNAREYDAVYREPGGT